MELTVAGNARLVVVATRAKRRETPTFTITRVPRYGFPGRAEGLTFADARDTLTAQGVDGASGVLCDAIFEHDVETAGQVPA